jgi:hypothetical protein
MYAVRTQFSVFATNVGSPMKIGWTQALLRSGNINISFDLSDGIEISVYRHPPACVVGRCVKFSIFQYFFIICQVCMASVSKMATR